MPERNGIDRRRFLKHSALYALSAMAVEAQQMQRIFVENRVPDSYRSRLAERELLRGLKQLGLGVEVRLTGGETSPGPNELLIALVVEPQQFRNPESYRVLSEPRQVLLSAAGEQALLYAVFDFLERQGAFFGIDGPKYPLEPASELLLPPVNQPWESTPRFAVRGLLPWPDFLNCISVYNEEDFRSYFESMVRMRFNTFGMHVYTGADQWAESYLSFEFAGVGHIAHLDTSATRRWGYLPQRDLTLRDGGRPIL